MATEEDLEKAKDEAADDEAEAEPEASSEATDAKDEIASAEGSHAKTEDELEAEKAGKLDDDAREAGSTPMQLGYMRFVYATYMGGAMLVALLVAKATDTAWSRLGQWRPEFGEPKEEVVYILSGLVGAGAALYYWRKVESRKYAIDVAEELSKVTWPSRKEVTNSTGVVLFYTVFATIFFALLDQFWKYVTDQIYSF